MGCSTLYTLDPKNPKWAPKTPQKGDALPSMCEEQESAALGCALLGCGEAARKALLAGGKAP